MHVHAWHTRARLEGTRLPRRYVFLGVHFSESGVQACAPGRMHTGGHVLSARASSVFISADCFIFLIHVGQKLWPIIIFDLFIFGTINGNF